MTTIAACVQHGEMAADSQWSDGAEVGPIRKVYRIRGALVGLAGDVGLYSKTVAWARAGFDSPAPRGDISVIVLDADGLRTWEPLNGWIRYAKQFAIGSGGRDARAAMLAGAAPRRAVQIACAIDAQSGGPVRVYRLRPP